MLAPRDKRARPAGQDCLYCSKLSKLECTHLQTTFRTDLDAKLKAHLPQDLARRHRGRRPAFPSRLASTGTVLPPTSATSGTPFTRGIGVYPGEPSAFFGPTFVIDSKTYRNLALNRPASQSSAYDYNLTAQCVTDGIVHTTMPRWISSATSTDGILPKILRETLVSHWPAATLTLTGPVASAHIELAGGTDVPEVDQVAVFVALPNRFPAADVHITVSVSDDGRKWEPVGSIVNPPPINGTYTFPPDLNRGNNLFYPLIALQNPRRSRFYQVELRLDGAGPELEFTQWRLGQIEFYRGARTLADRVQIGGPYSFTSAWMSAGLDEEWVAVDLGAPCTFDRVTLHWIARAAEGAIQTSNDGETWHTIMPLPMSATSQLDDIHLAPTTARHVRVLMTRPTSPHGYILSELEVFGRGGPVPKASPTVAIAPDGRLNLAGGSWRLQRSSETNATGSALSNPDFDDSKWLPATVPGTILTSYLNAGAIPDPNFGQNQLAISDSFFYSDFWYRTSFHFPAAKPGKQQWLNFDGIDWKAEVFLNGASIGRIDGGFTRARFDVTSKLIPGGENTLAVRVEKNNVPGSCKQKTYDTTGVNGGALGADNPTFHASIGWDWISTIRGRNTGIWGEVFLTETGALIIEDPGVSSVIHGNAADVTIHLNVLSTLQAGAQATIRGKFGDTPFTQTVTVPGPGSHPFSLPAMHVENAKLWWPVGYGDPTLHDVELTVTSDSGEVLDRQIFKAGIRQMTATEDGGNLRLFINGRRFIPRGGNWGFAESMLRYRAREYDVAVRYHREMNFTMIRNWVGQIPDDAFYDACDKYGVVVWQDFWLANPWDGPIPDDNALFLANARDLILRIRKHASIGLYVGRNEGFPPPALETGLHALLAELHPDIYYIGSSADGPVSGHGPYRALPVTYYFEHTDPKFHSEIGMPNIPPIESVELMMPKPAIWPQGLDWGLHDFTIHGAQGGSSFLSLIEDSYGGASTGDEWITLAQFLNYDGYRAMFEAQSKYRMGVLLWMSHPCWPSFVWQTYDFYFEPTAAYFGCKKACEPLHIQWNRATGFVEVVNLSAGDESGLTARLEILNMDGTKTATQSLSLDSKEDSVTPCLKLDFPPTLTPVHFLRLTLSKGATVLSTNFYMRGIHEDDYRAIRELPKITLTATTTSQRNGDTWMLTTVVQNSTPTPALMVRLKAVRETAGDRILPAIYSDNYIALMPGESRTVTTELNHADTRGQRPKVVLSGFNLK